MVPEGAQTLPHKSGMWNATFCRLRRKENPVFPCSSDGFRHPDPYPTEVAEVAGCRAAVAVAWSRMVAAWNRMTTAEFESRIRHIRGSCRYPLSGRKRERDGPYHTCTGYNRCRSAAAPCSPTPWPYPIRSVYPPGGHYPLRSRRRLHRPLMRPPQRRPRSRGRRFPPRFAWKPGWVRSLFVQWHTAGRRHRLHGTGRRIYPNQAAP
jgi:hypothetical protein